MRHKFYEQHVRAISSLTTLPTICGYPASRDEILHLMSPFAAKRRGFL